MNEGVILNETRQTRPPLATIICIYLIVTAFVPLSLLWIYLFGRFHSLSNGSHASLTFHPVLPHSPLAWVSCSLAIAGAIALWQLRRLAFVLLAIRLGLSLFTQVSTLTDRSSSFMRLTATMPRVVAASTVMRNNYLLIAAQWLISALIVWYVYRLTSPKPSSSRQGLPDHRV